MQTMSLAETTLRYYKMCGIGEENGDVNTDALHRVSRTPGIEVWHSWPVIDRRDVVPVPGEDGEARCNVCQHA